MQARIATRITIAAKPNEVFKYLKDVKYHYLWNPQIRTINPLIELEQGATYKTTSTVLGKNLSAKNVVTKYIEDRELEIENNTGMVHYVAKFRLTGKGSKTLLSCSTVVEAKSPAFAFAKPVLEILARRELQSDLQALKLAIEHKLEP